MATAGRILIMPKGAYDKNATYEMLDLVSYNGTSWLAKKTVTGIAPSEANSEYWHNMVNISEYLAEELSDYVDFTALEYSPSGHIASHQIAASMNGEGSIRLVIDCKLDENVTANTGYSIGTLLLPDDYEWNGLTVPVMVFDSVGEPAGMGCVALSENGTLMFVSNADFDSTHSIRGGNV